MAESKVPYLCGGVLFFLLAQTKPSKRTARDRVAGLKDDHKDPTVMEDLIYVVTGARGYGASKDTSNFRECLIDGSVNVPFNSKSVMDGFDDEVKNKYSAVLKRMTEFVNWHIAENKSEWLVKAVLEIIQEDEEILESSMFYVQPDGIPVSKAGIANTHEFWLPAFLVGVIHYIEMHRSDTNKIGVQTLEAIGSQQPHRERVYTGSLGTKVKDAISVHREYTEADNCQAAFDTKTEGTTFNKEHIEAEVVDDEMPSGAAEESKHVTVIHQQTNVVQNGENNFNLTNNGTMNFNF